MRVPPGERVLDVGCGSGDLLAALEPSHGVGIDVSAPAIRAAREGHASERLSFVEGDAADPAVLARAGGPFDTILLVNVVTQLTDVQATLEALHAVSHPRTRVLIYSYSRLWQPLLRLAELMGMKHRQPPEAWLPPEEIKAMLALADFEVVRDDAHTVCPVGIPLVADLLNRYLGRLPLVDAFSLMFGIIARPGAGRGAAPRPPDPTVSVVIPCRNEAGHIAPLVASLPSLPEGSEFLFVEGNSTDDTAAVIERAVAEHPELAAARVPAARKGQGRRRSLRLRAGEGRRAADPRFRHGRGSRRRAQVRERARARQVRDGERLAARLPDGRPRDALPEPDRQQVLRPALLLAARPAGARHAVRDEGALARGLRAHRGRTAPTSATSTRSATSTCCSAPRGSTCASPTSRCATMSGSTARRTSRASATAGCCCR